MELSEFYEGMTAVMAEDLPDSLRFVKGTVVVVTSTGKDWMSYSTNAQTIKDKRVMVRVNLPGSMGATRGELCYPRRLRPVNEQLSFDFGE